MGGMAEVRLAGGGRADITPPVGIALGGYGARTGPSTGIMDPLLARAAVFDDGTNRVALVVCDLLGVHRRWVQRARELVGAGGAVAPENVVVAATHTHAGPLAAVAPDGEERWVEATAAGVARAVEAAVGDLQPVTLKTTAVEVDIGRNRRHHRGPHEARLTVVAAEAADGRAVLTVMHHACHATVLEADNHLLSADFPGAACRAVERAVGGVAVYVQGACADLNPMWLAHDRAEVERVGGIVGLAAARAVHELRPVGRTRWVINLSYSEEVEVDTALGAVLGSGPVTVASTVVEIERRTMPTDDQIDAALDALRPRLAEGTPVEDRRRAQAEVNRLEMERIYRRWAPSDPGRLHRAEVQVLAVGADLVVAALPGEFFVETGWAIEGRLGGGLTVVAGYANHYLGYVPPAPAFADHGYEVGCARFTPEAANVFVDAVADLAAQVRGRT